MASYDFHAASARYHIRFRYGDKPYKRALRLEGEKEAERVCSVVEETLKDLKRGRLTKLKLNVWLRNDTGTTFEAFKPSWTTKTGQQPTIDNWSGLLKQQVGGGWGAHRGQITVANGQIFIASVAFDPTLIDADLRRRHETKNLGTLNIPLKINGRDVILSKCV